MLGLKSPVSLELRSVPTRMNDTRPRIWYYLGVKTRPTPGLLSQSACEFSESRFKWMATKIGLVNAKGGVGKTTTALALAAGLAKRSYRVLLVDCDFQCNASISLGIERSKLLPSLVEVFAGEPLEKVIRPTSIDNLSILTASPELIHFDAAVATEENKEFFLAECLEGIESQYDFIILDTSPSLGLLAVNVCCVADLLIVPVEPHYLATEGLVTLLTRIADLRKSLSKVGRICGILLTKVDRRQSAVLAMIGLLRDQFPHLIFEVEIPSSSKQVEAPSHGKVIYDYSPRSAPAKAYETFVSELIFRIGATQHEPQKS